MRCYMQFGVLSLVPANHVSSLAARSSVNIPTLIRTETGTSKAHNKHKIRCNFENVSEYESRNFYNLELEMRLMNEGK